MNLLTLIKVSLRVLREVVLTLCVGRRRGEGVPKGIVIRIHPRETECWLLPTEPNTIDVIMMTRAGKQREERAELFRQILSN